MFVNVYVFFKNKAGFSLVLILGLLESITYEVDKVSFTKDTKC